MSENLDAAPQPPSPRRSPHTSLTALAVFLALLAFVLLAAAIGWQLAPGRQVAVASPTRILAFTTGSDGVASQTTPSPTLPPRTPSPFPTVTPTPRVHTVQTGDTLVSIAAEYRVSYEELMEINQIDDPNRIFVGQDLLLPVSPPTPMPGSREHTVQEGETLFLIAIAYDVTVDDILLANGMTDPDTIYADQKLVIPPAQPTATDVPD